MLVGRYFWAGVVTGDGWQHSVVRPRAGKQQDNALTVKESRHCCTLTSAYTSIAKYLPGEGVQRHLKYVAKNWGIQARMCMHGTELNCQFYRPDLVVKYEVRQNNPPCELIRDARGQGRDYRQVGQAGEFADRRGLIINTFPVGVTTKLVRMN